MTSIETKRNITKLILVISVILLVVSSVNLLFPETFGWGHENGASPPAIDLETEFKEIKMKYDNYQEKIAEVEKNTNEMNQSIVKIGSYANNDLPKYATGAGISIIVGTWLSTIILYFRISRDLFKE